METDDITDTRYYLARLTAIEHRLDRLEGILNDLIGNLMNYRAQLSALQERMRNLEKFKWPSAKA